MQCRARLASVCRHWRTVSTSSHAAVVWRTLCVDETSFGRAAYAFSGSLMRWCQACGGHIQTLKLALTRGESQMRRLVMGLPCMIMPQWTQ